MTSREARAAEASVLRDQGLKLREIAARMGVAISTVNSWLLDPDGSRLKARKNSYRGQCERCDGPTTGGDGPTKAPTVCKSCLEWSDEEIIDAIRAWATKHGSPPTLTQWRVAGDDRPHGHTVAGRMGWNEALLRAGLQLHCDRRPETQAEIERLIREGLSITEVADGFGWTRQRVEGRLRHHANA